MPPGETRAVRQRVLLPPRNRVAEAGRDGFQQRLACMGDKRNPSGGVAMMRAILLLLQRKDFHGRILFHRWGV